MPILTIISIIICSILAPCQGNNNKYQVCEINEKGYLVAPPENYNCSLPDTESVLELEANLLVRRIQPVLFPIFKCQKIINHICTFSVLKVYTSISENFTAIEKVSYEDCWNLVSTGAVGNNMVERKDNNIWRSVPEIIELEYEWIGTKCNNSVSYVVERAVGAVNNEKEHIISDFPELTAAKCLPTITFCNTRRAMFVWKAPDSNALCTFQSVGIFPSLVADKFILIEKFQAAFVVKESESINLEQIDKKCLPPNTYACENDVFVAFPKLKYFIQSGNKWILPYFPDGTNFSTTDPYTNSGVGKV